MQGYRPFPGFQHPVPLGAVDPRAAQAVTQGLYSVSGGTSGSVQKGWQAVSQGTGAAASAGGTTAAILATAAGGAAAVPVAGWIAAGGLGLAAGTVAFVRKMREGRMSKAQAMALAQAYGIPYASELPAFTKRVFQASQEKRIQLAYKYESRLSEGKKWYKPGSWFRSDGRMRTKLAILGAVIAIEQQQKAAASAAATPVVPPVDNSVMLAAGMMGVLLLIAVLAKGGKGNSGNTGTRRPALPSSSSSASKG